MNARCSHDESASTAREHWSHQICKKKVAKVVDADRLLEPVLRPYLVLTAASAFREGETPELRQSMSRSGERVRVASASQPLTMSRWTGALR